MASEKRSQRLNCERKRRYNNEESAKSSRQAMIRKYGYMEQTLVVYKCVACSGFHIGNRPGSRSKNRRKSGRRR